jgi:hypothetical protein
MSNIECRRVGSLRSVIFYKIDRIPYFDIRYSLFDIRYSLFQSFFLDQTGRFSGQRRRLYETSSELRRVGHRADHIPAGTVARPTLPKFLFSIRPTVFLAGGRADT